MTRPTLEPGRIVARGLEILRRQLLAPSHAEVEHLVLSLLPALEDVPPSLPFVRRRLEELGVAASDRQVTLLCWLARGKLQLEAEAEAEAEAESAKLRR